MDEQITTITITGEQKRLIKRINVSFILVFVILLINSIVMNYLLKNYPINESKYYFLDGFFLFIFSLLKLINSTFFFYNLYLFIKTRKKKILLKKIILIILYLLILVSYVSGILSGIIFMNLH